MGARVVIKTIVVAVEAEGVVAVARVREQVVVKDNVVPSVVCF